MKKNIKDKKNKIIIGLVLIVVILVSVFVAYSLTEKVLTEYTMFGDQDNFATPYPNQLRAQTFITNDVWEINRIGVKAFKDIGATVGDVTLSIRVIDPETGYPHMTDMLALGVFNGDLLPEDGMTAATHEGNEEWVYVTLRDDVGNKIKLDANTVYSLVIKVDAAYRDIGFIFDSDCDEGTCEDPYLGGEYLRTEGGVWYNDDGAGDDTTDLLFKIFGNQGIFVW